MKKVRTVLPVIALLFAVGAAFTTGNANTLALVPVSLPFPASCEPIGLCQTIGATSLCTTPGGTILREYLTASETCAFSFNGKWETGK